MLDQLARPFYPTSIFNECGLVSWGDGNEFEFSTVCYLSPGTDDVILIAMWSCAFTCCAHEGIQSQASRIRTAITNSPDSAAICRRCFIFGVVL